MLRYIGDVQVFIDHHLPSHLANGPTHRLYCFYKDEDSNTSQTFLYRT